MKFIFPLLILFTSCSRFLYFPDRYLRSEPKQYGIEYEELWFKSSDGLDLNAWYLKNSQKLKKPKSLVLFYHGNAQNISSHYTALAWLTQHGHDVLIADYRGYGQSDGSPDNDGIYLDSLAMLDKAVEIKERDQHKKLIVYGQSLGGAIAQKAVLDSPHRKKIDLLVLDSTFSSYKDIAWSATTSNAILFIFSPFVYVFMTDKYATKDKLEEFKLPILVVHSKEDKVVPFKHGEYIYKNLKTQKKWFWDFKHGPHIHTFHGPDGQRRRDNFLKLVKEL